MPPPTACRNTAAIVLLAWSKEVCWQQWEEIDVGKLQKLRIGADGRPGRPIPAEPDRDKDDWVKWNLETDQLARVQIQAIPAGASGSDGKKCFRLPPRGLRCAGR